MLKKASFASKVRPALTFIIIPIALVVAWLIYSKILGAPENFEGGDLTKEPLKGNYLGVIYRGGPIVILLISFQIILVTFILERFLTIRLARGKSSNKVFVREVQEMLESGEREKAIAACDGQKGSLANVVKSGLETYGKVENQQQIPLEVKVDILEKELREATLLELPSLTDNLVIISTLASISTLIGLFGTVTGMIKAFAALARVGAPDAVGLAGGISQALVTTALGISTAAVAIVAYNFFVTKIDKIAYSMEEISHSILHAFKTREFLS